MPEFCTCGSELPPDALFCHKCGKPQREIVEPEVQVVKGPPPPPPPPPETKPLNFRNPVAMRIALLVAGFATLLSFLPYVNWLAAGFFSVFFYRRRTGQFLNLESGVFMGWITGLMMFAMTAILLAAFVAFMQVAGGLSAIQAELKGAVDPKVIDSLKALQSPGELAKVLVQFFFFTTFLSVVGAALGVKMAGRH